MDGVSVIVMFSVMCMNLKKRQGSGEFKGTTGLLKQHKRVTQPPTMDYYHIQSVSYTCDDIGLLIDPCFRICIPVKIYFH